MPFEGCHLQNLLQVFIADVDGSADERRSI
jgi:hypothetical protein